MRAEVVLHRYDYLMISLVWSDIMAILKQKNYRGMLLGMWLLYGVGDNMELGLVNNLVIQCNNCGKIHVIDKDSLEVNTCSYERQMGSEIEYNFDGESQCDNCGNCLHYSVRAFEYPVGALNYDDCECSGGHFAQSPEVAVRYYEFDYDENDEEYIYSEVCEAQTNIERILENNAAMYDLTSREFEELVAEVFYKQGYNVVLTPETRDGGCDIIATHNVGGLSYMILIECKKYGLKNKVGVQLVRSLLGVQTDQKVNKAVIVTSSTFTRDARDLAERQNTLIGLIDYNDLIRMMKTT